MFSFTSPGMKFDNSIAGGGGPPTLRLHGQTCQRIGTLLPAEGNLPQYAQLYIFDTDNEIDNRMKRFKYLYFYNYVYSDSCHYITLLKALI